MLVLALALASCDKPEDTEVAATPPASGPRDTASDVRPAGLEINGTLMYREREALPEDAVIIAQLVVVPNVDNPSPAAVGEVLAEQRQQAQGRQVPIPFSLTYQGSELDAGSGFGVRAEVRDRSGELRWSTLRVHPLATGKQAPMELMLGKVHSPAERVPAEDVQ